MVESALRFAFGGAPRNYAIPLRRDWVIGTLQVGPQQVESAVIAVVAMSLLFAFLAITTTGKAMRAVADNPTLADSKGIDPERMARIAVGIGMGLAGIGGMSEFSMMTSGVPWPLAYGAFALGMIVIGYASYHGLRYLEQRNAKQSLAVRRRKEG